MHLKAQGPVFVPDKFQAEIEKLSKATLIDMVWDYAGQCCENVDHPDEIMAELRKRAETILIYRKQAKSAGRQR